jgi:hypothetical protein
MSNMISRKLFHHVPLLVLVWVLLVLLQLVSSQTVSSDNCLSAPCEYVGECRDPTGACGDTTAHCNTESIWVPACGGGGGIYKPSTLDATVTSPAPAPTINTATAARPFLGIMTAVPSHQTLTAEPTTAWEAWVSGESDKDKGVIGLTTGNEGNENYTQTNGTDTWFNGDTWQNGRNETKDDGSLIDKIDFWNNDNSDTPAAGAGRQSKVEHVFLLPLALLFPVLASFF